MIPQTLAQISQVLIGTLFVVTGVFKICDLKKFYITVVKYGALPRQLTKPAAYSQPFIEVIIGIGVLLPYEPFWSSLAALTLLVVATGFVLFALLKNKKIDDCGCYGAIVKVPVTWKKAVENIIWIALAVILVWSAL